MFGMQMGQALAALASEVVGVSESRVSQILSATAKQLRKTLQVG